jgi:hypothetical protein
MSMDIVLAIISIIGLTVGVVTSINEIRKSTVKRKIVEKFCIVYYVD